MEYISITKATMNNITTFDGSEIILDLDFMTDVPNCKRFTIRYTGSLLHLKPNFIIEDPEYFFAIINQKIPFSENNKWLRDQNVLLKEISTSNHILEREKIKDLFKMD